MAIDMRENAITTLWRFALVVVPAILVLGVLNALPQFLGGEPLGVVRYASVADAQARLGVELYTPAALPRAWRWPPSRVRLAVGRPDWVQFVLDSAPGSDSGALVLCQTSESASADAQVPAALLARGDLLQAGDLSIGGRLARMQRVLLDDGAIVHELWWREGARRVMLRGRVPADSLPGLARTILGSQR